MGAQEGLGGPSQAAGAHSSFSQHSGLAQSRRPGGPRQLCPPRGSVGRCGLAAVIRRAGDRNVCPPWEPLSSSSSDHALRVSDVSDVRGARSAVGECASPQLCLGLVPPCSQCAWLPGPCSSWGQGWQLAEGASHGSTWPKAELGGQEASEYVGVTKDTPQPVAPGFASWEPAPAGPCSLARGGGSLACPAGGVPAC